MWHERCATSTEYATQESIEIAAADEDDHTVTVGGDIYAIPLEKTKF